MNPGENLLLTALVAFAAGVALGRLWGRLAHRSGSSGGRSRIGESIHYILGLDYLASQQIDRAIAELTRAVKADTEAIEIYLILGNLFREKGQVERAIQIHQSILHRPKLSPRERAHALLCLGIDFKRAGFRDRAVGTLEEVVKLDPKNAYALLHLEKIQEEEQNWEAALSLQQRMAGLTGAEDPTLAAFLYDQIGLAALSASDEKRAAASFQNAIRQDRKLPPPYLHLGDLMERQGRHREAVAQCEALLRESPEHAHLAFERLERLYPQIGEGEKIYRLYRAVATRDSKDWRAHLALGRLLARQGKTDESFELLLTAAERNPHAPSVHLVIWRLLMAAGAPRELIERYVERTDRSIFFLDPHVCVKCRYRTSGILWRCPHCQEWNTFVEERMSARPNRE